MNILFIGGNVFDADQITSSAEHTGFLQLIFKNGEEVKLPWRDEHERKDILKQFPPLEL